MRMFENGVLRRIFRLKRDEVTGGGGGEDYIMRSSMTCKIRYSTSLYRH